MEEEIVKEEIEEQKAKSDKAFKDFFSELWTKHKPRVKSASKRETAEYFVKLTASILNASQTKN